MKKDTIILIEFAFLFIGTIYFSIIYPLVKKDNDAATKDIVYSKSYVESVRNEVIEELYGNRETYASNHTGSRAEYIDKEASAAGELVIDEERMQKVYDSKLAEYDANIDHEKVDGIVTARIKELEEKDPYKGYNEKHYDTSRDVMYWEHGGKYFAIIELFFLMAYIIYIKRRKGNR